MSSFKIFNRLYAVIGIPWLFFVIFTSGSFTAIKISLLVILMIISVVDINIEKIKLNNRHTVFIIIFVLYCLFSLVLGLHFNYEFEFDKDWGLIQNYMLTPICVLLFSTVFGFSKYRKERLWKVLLFLTCILTVLDVLKVITSLKGFNPPFLDFIEISSKIANENKLCWRVKNESSLFFLLPISTYALFNTKIKKYRILCLISFVLGVIYAALSGRKMLEVLMVFVILFSLLHKRNIIYSLKKHMLAQMIILTMLILLLPYVVSYFSNLVGSKDIYKLVVDTLSNGLASDAGGVIKRVGNTEALIELWEQSPIVGNGLNSYALNSFANARTKWSYEVFYIAWLAQTGIIGLFLLFSGEFYIVKKLLNFGNMTGNKTYYALMMGFVSFIIAGASNPLLYFVWPWSIALSFCESPLLVKK